MKRVVTLLTDFGTRDHYVGTIKGVLLSINPSLELVDITHEVTPQNILEGGFVLASAFKYFPKGTVHLAVIDPGVGTKRFGLAAETQDHFFVGPYNGLFDQVFDLDPPRQVVRLENSDYHLPQVSTTFHARDIFAPVAAHLSLGLSLEKLGPPIIYSIRFPGRIIFSEHDELQGEIIHVDHFGNLISNIEIPHSETKIRLQDLRIYLAADQMLTGPNTYEEAPPGRPFALIGSSGLLEISVRNGSAHKVTGQGVGTPIRVKKQP